MNFPPPPPMTRSKSQVSQRFEEVFPVLVDEILALSSKLPKDAIEWFHKNLTHNASASDLAQGHMVMDVMENIKGAPLTELQFVHGATLGWAIQLLLIHLNMLDDVTDKSPKRGGKPAWHQLDNVKDIAINDASLLQNSCFYLIQKHHQRQPYYVDLLDLLHSAELDAGIGRMNERVMAVPGTPDLSKFSRKRYQQIATYKTAIPFFYVPVAAAMILMGETSTCIHDSVLRTCTQIGLFKHYQDDFNDLYDKNGDGSSAQIQQGRASWNIITALELASPAQQELLQEHYGKASKASEDVVLSVFNDLSLPAEFEKLKATSLANVTSVIQTLPDGKLKEDPFRALVDRIWST